jgi:hypothetical protein
VPGRGQITVAGLPPERAVRRARGTAPSIVTVNAPRRNAGSRAMKCRYSVNIDGFAIGPVCPLAHGPPEVQPRATPGPRLAQAGPAIRHAGSPLEGATATRPHPIRSEAA